MIKLSTLSTIDKNKLAQEGAFLVLLEINLNVEGIEPIRVVRNNEDITWNGQLWQAFPFELGDINEDTQGSIPSVELKVDNVGRSLQYYLEQGNGGNNATIILRVVNSENLSTTVAEVEEQFSNKKTTVTEQWVTFTLGNAYPSQSRRPFYRYLKNSCCWKYKGTECACTHPAETCNHTISDCRARGNSGRFGGFPGITQGGFYA